MNEIIFYPNKKKNLLVVFIAILVSVALIYILYFEPLFSKQWWTGVGLLSIFGICAAILSYLTLFNKKPYLTLNRQGLLAHKCPFIEWGNVKNVYFKTIKYETYMCIQPYNVNRLVDKEKLSFAKKLILTVSQSTFGSIVVIQLSQLQIKPKELLDLIDKFKSEWAKEHLRR